VRAGTIATAARATGEFRAGGDGVEQLAEYPVEQALIKS
jgi:hypothetical protein